MLSPEERGVGAGPDDGQRSLELEGAPKKQLGLLPLGSSVSPVGPGVEGKGSFLSPVCVILYSSQLDCKLPGGGAHRSFRLFLCSPFPGMCLANPGVS